jgi:hypothetical protein
MADKWSQLDDPRRVRLYRLLGEALEADPDDPRLEEAADILAEMVEQA